MPARAERSRRSLAGRAIAGALLVLAALPVYLTLEQSWRPIALRLACAVVVAAGCVRARRWVRDTVEPHAISAVDAPPREPPAPELDARFLRLRDDLIASTWSRRYFDVILWPRLSMLAGADLPRPAKRRGIPRLGPSLHTLEGLVAEVEGRL